MSKKLFPIALHNEMLSQKFVCKIWLQLIVKNVGKEGRDSYLCHPKIKH
jgi:hypothetical protein